MILCPVHDMPDCSPLLNGCSRVIELHKLVEREIVRRRAESIGDVFTVVCVKTGRRAGVHYSTWHNVSEEGIITDITFRYPNCDGIEDTVGDEVTLTLHMDEYGRAISKPSGIVRA